MDFLKKHYEKIALAAALLVLIVSAIWLSLKAGALSTEVQEAPRRTRQKSAEVKPTDLAPYSNAIVMLKEPVLWTSDPSKMCGEVVMALARPDQITLATNDVGPRIAYLGMERRPFKLLFLAYVYDQQSASGQNFQLNFQFRARTFFIPKVGVEVGDQFEKTGYLLASFERKSAQEEVPGLGMRDVDTSEIALRREGEKEIKLVLNKPTVEEEPIGKIVCGIDPVRKEVRRGQQFECEKVIYNVVDIDPKQMIIKEKLSGKTHTISLTAP